jgi:predicted ATPase
MVSIADVGFGVSQIIPVLVALRVAEDGRLVYLEEPEIHLHPRAQVRLADILADAAKRGVRVVAETHSSLLLRAVQTLVAKGELAADLVRLHWFSRDNVGVTHVKSVVPDENGAFGDWPEDFGDVNLQSEQDYLDAVESKLIR